MCQKAQYDIRKRYKLNQAFSGPRERRKEEKAGSGRNEKQAPCGGDGLGAVSSDGHVMPPHFFKPGEMVTADVYLHALAHVVKPWIERITGGADYVFQRDSVPAHTANRTQEWCQQNLHMTWPKDLWPPTLPI